VTGYRSACPAQGRPDDSISRPGRRILPHQRDQVPCSAALWERWRSQNAACTKLWPLRLFSSRRPGSCYAIRTQKFAKTGHRLGQMWGWYPQRWLHRSDFAARIRRTGLGPDPEIKPVRYVNRAEPSWKSKRMTTVTNDRAMDLEVLVLVVGDDGSCQCRSTTQGLGKKPSARTRRGVGACVLLLPHRKRTPNLRRMRWAGCLSRVGRERGGGFMPVRFAQSSRPVPKLCDP
jgi:hypothetical protein